MKPIVLLDRDGVINHYIKADYLKSPSEIRLIEPNIHALSNLSKQGFQFIIVSNQACVAKKLVTKRSIYAIHDHLKKMLSTHNINILDIYYCPHADHNNCLCRKPKPGMLNQAVSIYNLNKQKTLFVGDSQTDYQAAQAANIHFLGVETGNQSIKKLETNIPVVQNLLIGLSFFSKFL